MKHYLGICLVLLTVAAIAFFALRSCTSAVNQTVDHVRDAFTKALSLQPQVKVNQRVILTQTAPIAELAVVTKEELVTIHLDAHLQVLSIQVPLTEKTMTTEAVYRIKAGFDLHEAFSVEIDPATHNVTASMPPAKILSVEPEGEIKYVGIDATFNRITDDERVQVLTSLNAAARDAAENSSLKSEAEAQITQRLAELLAENGHQIDIKWKNVEKVPQLSP